MSKTSDITESAIWLSLKENYRAISSRTLDDLFRENPQQGEKYFLKLDGISLDYSKNHIDDKILHDLLALAREAGLEDQIEALFEGKEVNNTEHRAAQHTALRDPGQINHPQISQTLHRMAALSSDVQQGKRTGSSGKAFTHILHLGIGGANLGPQMVDEALSGSLKRKIPCDYLANIDANQLNEILRRVDAETTLVIIASKTFSTLETLTNARAVRQHFEQSMGDKNLQKHFIAVTASSELAMEFGIEKENIFPIWDFVGGRYSLWSAVGISLSLSYGYGVFEELLGGAHSMDRHFRTASLESNMPVILALLSIWYRNFFGSESHAVIPYDHYLRLLPAHLQQLIMESNGKSVKRDGSPVTVNTCPVIWGGEGTNGQHAFHQWLHQGTRKVTVDFILPLSASHGRKEYQDWMVTNCLAQSRALMLGRTPDAIDGELELANHRSSPGNQSSNTLLLDSVCANSLGALVALYEHKVFCEAVLWQINPFDQWGVELGKSLADEIYTCIQSGKVDTELDASTRNLLSVYQSVTRS